MNFLSPFLCKENILTTFHCVGNLPVEIEKFIMKVRGTTRTTAPSLRISEDIPSCPWLLLHSRVSHRFRILLSKFQMFKILIRPIKSTFFESKPFKKCKNFSKILIFRYCYFAFKILVYNTSMWNKAIKKIWFFSFFY